MSSAIILILAIAVAGSLIAWLHRVIRTDGYGSRSAPRSWPDDRSIPPAPARLAR